MRKYYRTTTDQPCWTCKKYIDGCSWARSRTPVEGWTAEKKVIKSNTKADIITYKIHYCPEYEEG